MPQPRLSMRKIREILRMSAQGASMRTIGASVGSPRSTVCDCLGRAQAAELSWPLPDDLDNAVPEAQLYPPPRLSTEPRPALDCVRNRAKPATDSV